MFDIISKMKQAMGKFEEAGALLDPTEDIKKVLNLIGPAVVNPREILETGAVRPMDGRPAIITENESSSKTSQDTTGQNQST